MASSFICTSIDLLSSGGLKVMPVSFVSSLLCTLKSFLIVQASPFSNPVSNFLNCLLSFRDRSSLVDGCDIDQSQIMQVGILQTGNQCLRRVKGSQYIHTCLDRVAANQETIFGVFNSLGRSIDDQIDLMSQNQVHQVRRRLLQLICPDHLNTVFL